MSSKPNQITDLANSVGQESSSDVYFYNGPLNRGSDLAFIRTVHKEKSRKNATLILVTSGGDPDAAYKMARYIQNNYDSFTVIVSGLCKSAGTLIAVGAHCIAFAPYGELGPIDIQTYKIDNLAERQSGLTITESINHLTRSAIKTHGGVFGAIMNDTDAIISFKTAAQAASELVTGLFSPIFSQIDPMEVGEKARSMRIASDYGSRLNARTKNLKDGALQNLTQTYPSHSFVIDMQEAEGLFQNVRTLTDAELELVECLRVGARHELRPNEDEPTFLCLSEAAETETSNGEATDRAGSASGNGENSAAAAKSPSDRDGQRITPDAGKDKPTRARRRTKKDRDAAIKLSEIIDRKA